MTNTLSADPINGAKPASAKKMAVIWCALILGSLIASVALSGGHPRSNWIYPFVVVLGALGAVRILARGDRPMGAGDAVPKSIPRALAGSALMFVATATVMYVYWSLLWTETFTWGADVVVGGMTAVNYYRQKRGYAYSSWPSAIVFFVVLGASILLLWAGVIPRGHF